LREADFNLRLGRAASIAYFNRQAGAKSGR